MTIKTIKTGATLVSSAVPDRSSHKNRLAYTGLFQKRSARISVPVKCFYAAVAGRHVLIDSGWSVAVTKHPVKHLGFGLWFASEPVMKEEEAAINQLKGQPVDGILMTHLDCDHVSGLKDFSGIPVYVSREEVEYAAKKRIRYGSLPWGHDYTFLSFSDNSDAPFGRAADVFGDGSVLAFLTPTHSAGSVIYKISEKGTFALVVGDNGYHAGSWENGLLPGPLFDQENMKYCLRWIKEQSRRKECIGVYCAHDPYDR